MSHREALRMLLRLTDFIAGGRRDDLEREIEEPDVDEFVESQNADEKLRIKEFLLMVRKFVKGKLKETFPHRTFRWSGDVLMTKSASGDVFPVIRFERWGPETDQLVCWFRLRCDYAIVNNELYPNRGHHRIWYEADGDSIWFLEGVMECDAVIEVNGRVQPRQARVMVDGKLEMYGQLRDFLVGDFAERLVNSNDSDMDALHGMGRPR